MTSADFTLSSTWRVDDNDTNTSINSLFSTDGVGLIPSSLSVASQCELLLTCSPTASAESAGIVSFVLHSRNVTDDTVAARLVVNGGQESCSMTRRSDESNGTVLFEATYDVHPRMTSSIRIRLTNMMTADKPSVRLSSLLAKMHRSKRLDAPRPPLSQLLQMFVPPQSQSQQQERKQEQTSAAAAQAEASPPPKPIATQITRDDLDALEQRLMRHIDQRFDALTTLLNSLRN